MIYKKISYSIEVQFKSFNVFLKKIQLTRVNIMCNRSLKLSLEKNNEEY